MASEADQAHGSVPMPLNGLTQWARIHPLLVGAMMGRSKTVGHDGFWRQAQGIRSDAAINANLKGMPNGE